MVDADKPDYRDPDFRPENRFWPETHRVANQPPPLADYNSFLADRALCELVDSFAGDQVRADLERLGGIAGSASVIELGFQANGNPPELATHDRRGVRVDEVRYHPAYHELMRLATAEGLHASHWRGAGAGAHVARAARYYLLAQVEAGHGCPITMTSAVIPSLRHQPDLFEAWSPKVLALDYDPSNRPASEKDALTFGMAMTEKQGGSDVRQNSTRAYPVGSPGPGEAYELVGHKYFVSAPMSDAFMVLAQAEDGLSCFLVPRWRPDGTKNPLQLQQLKNKMGNASNASAETELRGALGWLVGEEGRGVAVIIEMVAMTRFDCMIGSSAGMRQAVAQAAHHCRHRTAFGKPLIEQPLMRNVLTDLALESEAALAVTLRIARALDRAGDDESEALLVRIGTAIGKYWVCKRAPGHAYEAMECIGGMGVMENTMMPRLYREAPVNAIWEGSGNVQCLDLQRILAKTPRALDALEAELGQARGTHAELDRAIDDAIGGVRSGDLSEAELRRAMQMLALAFQGSTLARFGDGAVAEAFCAARLAPGTSGRLYGDLPAAVAGSGLAERAVPQLG